MNQRITREDARSLLASVGLSASDERLESLARGLQAARAATAALVSLDMGYRGPPSFHVPPPANVQRNHGN
jgi:hypothetical protein